RADATASLLTIAMRQAMLWGSGPAIVMRLLLTFVVSRNHAASERRNDPELAAGIPADRNRPELVRGQSDPGVPGLGAGNRSPGGVDGRRHRGPREISGPDRRRPAQCHAGECAR